MKIEVELLPEQAAMIDFPETWMGVKGGQGSGKTSGAFWFLYLRLQRWPGSNFAVAGPDFENLRRAFFPDFVAFLTSKEVGLIEDRDFKYVSTPSPKLFFYCFKRVAKLHALSAELQGRIRGIRIQTIVGEEVTEWQRGEEFFKALTGRLRHTKEIYELYPDIRPQGLLIFNPPKTTHWLFELTMRRWPAQGYRLLTMSTRKNHLIPGLREYLQQAETNLARSKWGAEIDGEWDKTGGSVYRDFNYDIHCTPTPGLPYLNWVDPNMPLVWGLDFNVQNMASTISQGFLQRPKHVRWDYHFDKPPTEVLAWPVPNWQPFIIRFIDEFWLQDAGIKQVVDAFLNKYYDHAMRNGVVLTGDASGGARSQLADSQSSVRSNWQMIQALLNAQHIQFKTMVPKRNPSVKDRINFCNAQFNNSLGYGVSADPVACKHLVMDWQGVEWAENGYDIEKKKNPLLTHASDSGGYSTHTLRSLYIMRENAKKRLPRNGVHT